ncbi:MAG: hypothetical protein ACRDDX_15230 [Cellulosilyticaceae bacterium]
MKTFKQRLARILIFSLFLNHPLFALSPTTLDKSPPPTMLSSYETASPALTLPTTTPPAIIPPVEPELPDFAGGVITAIANSRILGNMPTEELFLGEDLSYIYSLAEDFCSPAVATIRVDTITYTDISLEISWDYTAIDTSIPGLYHAYGTIIPPTDCTFAPGVLTQIVIPVLIEAPLTEPLEINHIINEDILFSGQMLVVDDMETWEDLLWCWEMVFRSLSGYAKHPLYPDIIYEAQLHVTALDISTVTIHEPGEYSVTVSLDVAPDFKDDFYLSERLQTLTIPIKVADPNLFEVWLMRIAANRFYLTWCYPMDEISDILYVASDTPLSVEALLDATWTSTPDGMALAGGQVFTISRSFIDLNKHYYFRLKADDQLSHIVHLIDDGSSIHSDYIGGDRDGSGGIPNPPPVIQPPPDWEDDSDDSTSPPPITSPDPEDAEDESVPAMRPSPPSKDPTTTDTSEPLLLPLGPPSPSNFSGGFDFFQFPVLAILLPLEAFSPVKDTPPPSKLSTTESLTSTAENSLDTVVQSTKPLNPTPPMEVFGETQDDFSGTRLHMMLENQDTAYFSKQGITLAIPKTSILSKEVLDTDWLQVTIEKQSDTKWAFNFFQNDGQRLTLENIVAQVPYKLKNPSHSIMLINDSGERLCEGTYDDALALATFVIQGPGIFEIVEYLPTDDGAIPSQIPPAPDHVLNASTESSSTTSLVTPPVSHLLPLSLVIGFLLISLLGIGTFIFFRKRGHL